MIAYQKSKIPKILLLAAGVVLISAFLGTISATTHNGHTYKNSPVDDSTQIILFLDTTVLGPFFFPVKGKVISHYGKRGGRMHTGTDIKLAHGDTVRAAFSGVVAKAESYYGYGLLVILRHPKNLETYYSHLSKMLVKEGDSISYGTPLGLGGRTGRATTEHLHFEIRNNGKALNSEHFFNFNDQNIKSMVLLKKKDINKVNTGQSEKAELQEAAISSKKKVFSPVTPKKKYHTIRKGDTLFSLSKKYSTTVDEICKLNKLNRTSILKVGVKLRVL